MREEVRGKALSVLAALGYISQRERQEFVLWGNAVASDVN